MQFTIKTFGPQEKAPDKIIIPKQTHSSNIVELKTGQEDLSDCDGLWCKVDLFTKTERSTFTLGVKTADCAPIVFYNSKKYGIIHAGWRGTVNGIIEKMADIFTEPDTKIWVGPILPRFEIQKDFCFESIEQKFGSVFFTENQNQVVFEFKDCLAYLLPRAQFDTRNTYEDKNLASWRRDQDKERNVTVIGFQDLWSLLF